MRVFLLFTCLCTLPLGAQSDSLQLLQTIEAYTQLGQLSTGLPWQLSTEASTAGEIESLSALRAQLPAADRLSDRQRIDRALLDYVLDDQLFGLRFGHYLFPLDAEGGLLAEVIYRFSGRRIESEVAYAKHLNELRTLPAYFRGQEANMRRGLAIGKVNPRRVIELNLALIERQLATPAGESIFVLPVAGTERADRLMALTQDSIYPAYTHLRDFLTNDYLPGLPEGIGIAEITDGKDFYRQRVRFFTSDTAATPESVFATGKQEVARIRAEMDSLLERTGFAGSFAEFLLHLRTSAEFYAATPQQLLDRASWITNRIQTAAPRYFDPLPRMPLVVAPVPRRPGA